MSSFSTNIERLDKYTCPQNWTDLLLFLQAQLRHDSDCNVLRQVSSQLPSFYSDLLPFVWAQARKGHTISRSLRECREIVLSEQECLQILSAGFLCLFNRDSSVWEEYPSINFDLLYEHTFHFDSESPKLKMLLQYFQGCQQRIEEGVFGQRKVRFSLLQHRENQAGWSEVPQSMGDLVMVDLYRSIYEAKDCLRVDFANAYLGGASLSYGNVQEEIMFSLCPEMNVGRLFCKRMNHDEAILMVGPEQFSVSSGYGGSLQFAGPFPSETKQETSYTVAMDALDLRSDDPSMQYHPTSVLRELNKSYAAFSAPDTPHTIATGNWGCGVFGGDVELKTLIQWTSASRAGKTLLYHPFEQEILHRKLSTLSDRIRARKDPVGVAQMIHFLLHIQSTRSVLHQFEQWLSKL